MLTTEAAPTGNRRGGRPVLQAGATGWILKPIAAEQLRIVIRQMLAA